MMLYRFLSGILIISLRSVQSSLPPSLCSSKIFCDSEILKKIQLSSVFLDDKTFVDKPTLKPESEILEEFKKLGENPSRADLRNFVDANFGDENSFLKPAALLEWTETPVKISSMSNVYIKGFARVINKEWKKLVRVQDKSQLCIGCVTTLLDIEGTFIVPGGRFREFYYWDSYFVLEGLLLSGLYKTAKEIIYTLVSYVKKYGFVPNGSREYYLNRSQPPLLAHMVNLYFNKIGDIEFVMDVLPSMKVEHQYWMDHHTVDVQVTRNSKPEFRKMFRYNVNATYPRPEGYKNDYILATKHTHDTKEQHRIYSEIATGAESGFDFSTRWVNNTSLKHPSILAYSITSQIIPSDLNAILYYNQKIIASLSKEASLVTKSISDRKSYLADEYAFSKLQAQTFRNIMDLIYDKETGMFFDFNLISNDKSPVWSLANMWPYWYLSDSLELQSTDKAWNKISSVLKENIGGLPATLINSGLQWDYPAAWPPLQYVIVKGLMSSANAAKGVDKLRAKKYTDLALEIANKMVGSSFCAWYKTGGSIPGILEKLPNINDTGHIFEKYDSTSYGHPAGGGEYTIQSGFGWTNGVLLWMMDLFRDSLETPKCVQQGH